MSPTKSLASNPPRRLERDAEGTHDFLDGVDHLLRRMSLLSRKPRTIRLLVEDVLDGREREVGSPCRRDLGSRTLNILR